jgi:hypothetical protein
MKRIVGTDGTITTYNDNDEFHSFNNNPSYYAKGQYFEDWMYHKNGARHREGGPAVIYFRHNVNYSGEGANWEVTNEYYMDGKLHNLIGPAVEFWAYDDDPRVIGSNGKIEAQFYFVDGVEMDEKDYLVAVMEYKHKHYDIAASSKNNTYDLLEI